MKTKQLVKVLPLVLTLSTAQAQTAAERLEQGVQLQSAEGDLKGAITEYQAVLKATAKSQRLAAEARYRLAECYAKLGDQENMNVHLECPSLRVSGGQQVGQEGLFPCSTDLEFRGHPLAGQDLAHL